MNSDMLNKMIQIFISAFNFPGTNWESILIAIVLGIIFGSIWLALYRTPLFHKPWLWEMAIVSAILTWTAIAFIQIPLQNWTGQTLLCFWNARTLTQWILLAAIPQILLSGLVQEASKLVPVLFYWWRNKKAFTPKFGLIVGAISGAGFGVFEAIWEHNQIFASGWTWNLVETTGLTALLGFWERLFAVALHIATSALVGYGLAKRKGLQFYLIASFLHGLTNYSVVLLQTNHLTSIQAEIYLTAISVSATIVTLWLRWHKPKEIPVDDTPVILPDTTPQTPMN